MGLGCKIDDIVGIVVRDELCDELFITDITVNKDMARIIFQILQILQVTGIGQGIQIYYLDVCVAIEHVVDEGRSDEARATGY